MLANCLLRCFCCDLSRARSRSRCWSDRRVLHSLTCFMQNSICAGVLPCNHSTDMSVTCLQVWAWGHLSPVPCKIAMPLCVFNVTLLLIQCVIFVFEYPTIHMIKYVGSYKLKGYHAQPHVQTKHLLKKPHAWITHHESTLPSDVVFDVTCHVCVSIHQINTNGVTITSNNIISSIMTRSMWRVVWLVTGPRSCLPHAKPPGLMHVWLDHQVVCNRTRSTSRLPVRHARATRCTFCGHQHHAWWVLLTCWSNVCSCMWCVQAIRCLVCVCLVCPVCVCSSVIVSCCDTCAEPLDEPCPVQIDQPFAWMIPNWFWVEAGSSTFSFVIRLCVLRYP